jgi:hypothetical protein
MHPEDCIGGIHSACDVRVFHMTVTVRCRESEPENSRFCYHTHRWLRFVRFACEVDSKIYLNYIHFLIFFIYKYI